MVAAIRQSHAISIHALRKESDTDRQHFRMDGEDFNPRSP